MAGVSVVDPQAWRNAVGSSDPLKGVGNIPKAHLTPGWRGVAGSLGVTGGALGGVFGVAEVLQGARHGDPRRMLSGATEITLATATLAAVGLVPGAAGLAPMGASLLGLRGLNTVHSGQEGERVGGWRDLVTSASAGAALLSAPVALVAGLGITALSLNALSGLSKIKKGYEQKDSFKSAQGHGAMLSALGVGFIATGLAVAPGVGLLVAGGAFPLLQRWQRTRGPVDTLTGRLDPLFYPAAGPAQKIESSVQKAVQPLLAPAFRWSSRVWRCKPMQPVRLGSRLAGRKLSRGSQRVALVLQQWVGRVRVAVKAPPGPS